MSVILDALKKLDREKSIRQPSTANIAVEILRPDLPRPENRFFRYFAPILLTAIGATLITYFTMVYFLKKSSPPASMISSATSQRVISSPEESNVHLKSMTPSPSQPMEPASVYREPLHETRKEMGQVAPKMEVPPQSKVSGENKVLSESKPIPAPLEEKKADAPVISEKKDILPGKVPEKVPQTQVTESATTPSLLKVSAIVWYDDPSMRFAIINGLKVTEGSLIEGVKVVEIKPTSVRLFHNEKYFELSIER